MVYQWTKAKTLDGDLANEIRKDIRRNRKEHGRGGHRFHYSELKNIWHVDHVHAVINHNDDPSWQHYYNDPKDGWQLVHWYGSGRCGDGPPCTLGEGQDGTAGSPRPRPMAQA